MFTKRNTFDSVSLVVTPAFIKYGGVILFMALVVVFSHVLLLDLREINNTGKIGLEKEIQ